METETAMQFVGISIAICGNLQCCLCKSAMQLQRYSEPWKEVSNGCLIGCSIMNLLLQKLILISIAQNITNFSCDPTNMAKITIIR